MDGRREVRGTQKDPATSGTAVPAGLAAAALERAPDGFMALTSDLEVVGWNRTAETVLGWSAGEVVGRSCPGLDERGRRELRDVLLRIAAGEDVGSDLRRWGRADGSSVVLQFRGFVTEPAPQQDAVWFGAFFREAGVDQLRLHRRNVLSSALVGAVRTEQVAGVLTDAVESLLGGDGAVVLRPCDTREHLHGHLALGGHDGDVESVTLALDGRHTPVVRAVDGETATVSLDLGWDRPRPTLLVPMGPREHGWVLAVAYSDAVPDEPGLPEVARALADEGWVALQRAALVGELEGKVEILEATAAVAASAGLELDDVLAVVCQHAAAALSCERAAVYLRDDADALRLAHLHATDHVTVDDDGLTVARRVVAAGDPVLVQDTTSADELDGPWCRLHGAVAVLGLPLIVAGRQLGALVVAHTEAHPRGFTSLCQQVAGAVAQQASIAIENARLFASEQATVSRLQELDDLRGTYVDGITHDLRTPLSGLVGFVETLQRLGGSASAEDRQRFLDAMERQATRLVRLVDDLLLAARLDGGTLTLGTAESLEVSAVIDDALDSFDTPRRERIALGPSPGPLRLWGDRSQLVRIVSNLVENALKYSPEDRPVRVGMRREGHEAVITVTDEGPGMGEEELAAIFDRFRSGAQGAGANSPGLGLFISRGMAQAHGGDVTVDSRPGEGATFAVRLPVLDLEGAGADG